MPPTATGRPRGIAPTKPRQRIFFPDAICMCVVKMEMPRLPARATARVRPYQTAAHIWFPVLEKRRCRACLGRGDHVLDKSALYRSPWEGNGAVQQQYIHPIVTICLI